MRYPFDCSDNLTSWRSLKNQGNQAFARGEYQQALDSYKTALAAELEAPRAERQILLSNLVACRLKLGGLTHATAAVEEAKECVELNPSWSKAHVRLASAYIAKGGHSNDACNALQTALRLDPGNAIARQMLIRELRRDHAGASAASPDGLDGVETTSTTGGVPPPPQNPNFVPDNGDRVDDTLSLTERFQLTMAQFYMWYSNQSNDVKSLLKAIVVIVILYVAFGGRFGLESLGSSGRSSQGNYGHGNAYDQFQRRTSGNHHGGKSYHSVSDRHDTYRGYTGGHHYGGGYGGYGGYGLGDGGLTSLFILLGIAYVCHLNGINPIHGVMMANMLGRGRRGGEVSTTEAVFP